MSQQEKLVFLNWMALVSGVAWLLPVKPDGVPPPEKSSPRHVATSRATQREKLMVVGVFISVPFSLRCVRDVRRQIWTPPIQNGRFEQTNSLACYSTYIFKTVLRSNNNKTNHKRGERRHTHTCANGIARKSLFFLFLFSKGRRFLRRPRHWILNACYFLISRISHSVWLQAPPLVNVPSFFSRSFNVSFVT